MLAHERPLWARGLTLIAGVDEVGAGPLAGPVVAAAVILPEGCTILRLNDSKKLSAAVRARLAPEIRARATAYAIASCSVAEIDERNIYQASLEAMRRAVALLDPSAEHVLVDARRIPGLDLPQTAIVHGDAKSQAIAAASVIAKVYRDELMQGLDAQYPGYGFAKHKGYGTRAHLAALAALGPCAIHRRSFGPCKRALLDEHRRSSRADGQRATILVPEAGRC